MKDIQKIVRKEMEKENKKRSNNLISILLLILGLAAAFAIIMIGTVNLKVLQDYLLQSGSEYVSILLRFSALGIAGGAILCILGSYSLAKAWEKD